MNDLYYEILLNSDIEDIDNLCMINKSFNNICQSKYFWIDKFNKDKLPLIKKHNKTVDWVIEYKKVLYVINRVNNVLMDLNNHDKTIINLKYVKQDISFLYDNNHIENYLPYDLIITFKNNEYFMEYREVHSANRYAARYYNNNPTTIKILNENEIKDLLIKLFYITYKQ